jgi:hypothetical protein
VDTAASEEAWIPSAALVMEVTSWLASWGFGSKNVVQAEAGKGGWLRWRHDKAAPRPSPQMLLQLSMVHQHNHVAALDLTQSRLREPRGLRGRTAPTERTRLRELRGLGLVSPFRSKCCLAAASGQAAAVPGRGEGNHVTHTGHTNMFVLLCAYRCASR